MDTPQINTIEWFFGYGGNHLGLRRAIPSLRLIAACEIEAYACANMVQKMEAGSLDPAPIWTDCKTFPCAQFRGLVDLFIASYPCQGFSCAGKRQGDRDPRFLWPWVFRFVVEARPSVVLFENVEGHVSLGLNAVLSDLEEAGYRCTWGIFSAAEVGAPQRRKRVFILGYDTRFGGREGRPEWSRRLGQSTSEQPSSSAELEVSSGGRRSEPRERSQRPGRTEVVGASVVANSKRAEWRPPACDSGFPHGKEAGRDESSSGLRECDQNVANAASIRERESNNPQCTESRNNAWENAGGRGARPWFWSGFVARPGEPQCDWEPPRARETERGLGGGTNGRASNVDRLRLLGNGVYPAVAAKAFLTLAENLNSGSERAGT